MIRIAYMDGIFYGKTIESIEDDLENIEIFVNEGTPIILVDTLGDLDGVGFDEEDVTMMDD